MISYAIMSWSILLAFVTSVQRGDYAVVLIQLLPYFFMLQIDVSQQQVVV